MKITLLTALLLAPLALPRIAAQPVAQPAAKLSSGEYFIRQSWSQEQEFPLKDIAAEVGQSCESVIKALVRLRQALAACVEKKLKLQEFGL